MSPTNESPSCPACDAPLSSGAIAGLCSRCLVAQALDPGEPDPLPEVFPSGPPSGGGLPSPGELAGKLATYRIQDVVGRGGMGAVYRSTDEELERDVAMKVILPEAGGGPGAVERFTREALVLARLEHPNIVPIHEMPPRRAGPASTTR